MAQYTTLKHGALYPLADWAGRNKMAVWTGEKRPPRKGEWYLSGAIVEAYRAPNDLTTPFHIARVVTVKIETAIREVQS